MIARYEKIKLAGGVLGIAHSPEAEAQSWADAAPSRASPEPQAHCRGGNGRGWRDG